MVIFYQISGMLWVFMAYRYHSRRSARKLAKKSKQNFIITLFLIALLTYATVKWLLPSLVNGVGFVKNKVSDPPKIIENPVENSLLAPPVLNIPYEATNTARISIKGYGSPNSKVAIFLDDEEKDTIEVSEDGGFEFKNIELSLGTNNIYGKSIDEKNKESLPSKNFQIIYDNEKPRLELSEPEDGKQIQGGDKRIKISGSTKVGARVFINEGQIIVDKDGKFSSEQSLNDGDNIFNIKAIDIASNTTEISRRVIYQP